MSRDFVEKIISISKGDSTGASALTSLRDSLIEFASETDDNRNCADSLKLMGNKIVLGDSGESLGDLLSRCEETQVFHAIQDVIPELNYREIEALLRFCTLLFVALENLPKEEWH